MAKQGVSKKSSMAEHGDLTAKTSPKPPLQELPYLWHTSIAERLSKHMDTEPASNPRTSRGYDHDSYLAWLKQYARIKLEQSTAFKHTRTERGTTNAYTLEYDRSQRGERRNAKSSARNREASSPTTQKDSKKEYQWGRGSDLSSARDIDMHPDTG